MPKKDFLLGVVLVAVFFIIFISFPQIKIGSLQERRKVVAKLQELNDKGFIENFVPCKIKAFYEAYPDWVVLCKNYPFKNKQSVKKEVVNALKNTGLLCPGYSWPASRNVNELCEFYCS